MTLVQIADKLGITVRTLRTHFDALGFEYAPKPVPLHPVTMIIDATFFGRCYGYLCFCDGKQIVHFLEIKTESVADLTRGISDLVAVGYQFRSFTIDGKRGFIATLQRLFPNIPVQMCLFHQKCIIRRYITSNPKSACGIAIKNLTAALGEQNPTVWKAALQDLLVQHKDFLSQKNEAGRYTHTKLRSALRSLQSNLPFLFAYHDHPLDAIPKTSNAIEGRFAHLKEKITLHRGLKIHRKKNAICFLLNTL
jgi:mRNA-degrading endonuclease YafQ of YafQ-DinJ toxin-antitoxin module